MKVAKFQCKFCKKVYEEEEINNLTKLRRNKKHLGRVDIVLSWIHLQYGDIYYCPKCHKFVNVINFKRVKEEQKLKTYKTLEAIGMLIENPKLRFKMECMEDKYNPNLDLVLENNRICWANGNEFSLNTSTLNTKWILIQQPVTFEDVINSDKPVRVEYPTLKALEHLIEKVEDKAVNTIIRNFVDGNWLNFCDLMICISYISSSIELKEIIKNGKWYLKED